MAARYGAAQGGPIEQGKALPGGEAERLAHLEPRGGDGIEPGQHDAGGKGAVQHDMGEENAGEAKGRIAERETEKAFAELIDPAIAPPDGKEAEGDDHARRNDGRGEEADDEIAAGETQAIERPGEGRADDEREDRGKTSLQAGHAQKMGDVDARADAVAGRGSEQCPEHERDQSRDRGGQRDGRRDAEGTMGQGQRACPRHGRYWIAVSISSIHSRLWAAISASVKVRVFSGSGRAAKAGSSWSPRSATGNIQLVCGMICWASDETR